MRGRRPAWVGHLVEQQLLNTLARDMREQTTAPKVHIIFNIFIILKFGDYIWNHHYLCIQISTNMPDIGSIVCEI